MCGPRSRGIRALADRRSPPLIELTGIVKAYPGCLANDRIDLSVAAGEIHALLGENGAGKSTLVKIMAGVVAPDAGEIRWQGKPVAIDGPAAARRLGIGMVFQHFTLFESLTVTENVALGAGPRGATGRRWPRVSATSPSATGSRSIPIATCIISRSASASASRSCAACSRSRASSCSTSLPRC